MGQCAQCDVFLPPHFLVDVEIKGEEVQKCAYCYLDKTEVTTVDEQTGKEEKLTKKEASKRYQIFLKRLSENPNIAAVIEKSKSMPHLKG